MKTYIEKYRIEKGMSLNELAIKSGVAVSHLHNIEAEKKDMTLTILCKIAKALGVPAADLFSCGDE